MTDARTIARMIDHTLLKPEATPDQIEMLCDEASQYQFAAVCVNPTHVERAVASLQSTQSTQSTQVAVCTVVGFPLGATLTAVKVFETEQAIKIGATEIDMVINIGALKAGDDDLVRADIAAVVAACGSAMAMCKVIIETALLTDEEKERACRLAVEAQADYVKTSTGFSTSGAKVDDVALMRRVVGPNIGVKAAGGMRTLTDARAMVTAGATRLGTSSGVKIVSEEW